ncbi:MAG: tetratricopeptide repeat protein [Eggerthellaceae bacterium]|nr:tetratricopeptide repeat protein [Eggerthellaceae bacterium]
MNNEIFQQAHLAYEAKDFQTARNGFTKCLHDAQSPLAPGELGLLYHQIGNCLVKLKDYHEAIHAYTQATADSLYDASGVVNHNLGMAYAALHDYENAIRHFELAVTDAKYDTPFKAYSSMGNALLKLGKSAEAGVAFRQAALDERNPDPTKALLNLGICFMALNRPQDAIASYESALPFSMDTATRNKLFANLGQAYVAAGQMQQAVAAFETALADKSYHLNDSASVDYQLAVAAIASGAAETTGSLMPLGADMSGLDVITAEPAGYAEDGEYIEEQDPYYYPEAYGMQDGYESSDDRFFNASDEELEQWSKGIARQQRRHRNVGLKVAVGIIVVLLLALAALAFAYTQGFGYPTQESVIEELFADPEAAADTVFIDTAADITEMVNIIVADPAARIDGMNRSMSESVAFVTARTQQGGDVQYKVTLVRDMIGWKVSHVEIYYASQQGSADGGQPSGGTADVQDAQSAPEQQGEPEGQEAQGEPEGQEAQGEPDQEEEPED